jgi:hypothetical protein
VLSGAHLDAVAAALLVGGVALAWPYAAGDRSVRRPGWSPRWGGAYGPVIAGALLCGLAAGIKITALLGAVWIAARQLRRRPGATGFASWQGATGAVLGALGALTGLVLATLVGGVGLGWLSSLGTPGRLRTGVAPADTLARGIARIADVLGGSNSSGALSASRAAVAAVGLLIACWFLLGRPSLRGSRQPATPPTTGDLAGALLAVALAGPVLYPWYLAPALAVLAVTGQSARRLLAACSVLLLLAALPTVRPLAEEVSGGAVLALISAVGLGLLVALAGRRPDGGGRDDPGAERTADRTASTALTAAATSSALRDSSTAPATGRPWSRSL